MRILWFTNNSSVGANRLENKDIGCAWIVSLEAELVKNPDHHIGIAFTCKQQTVSQFSIGSTRYFPIPLEMPESRFQKVAERYTHAIERETIVPKYLEVVEQFKPDVIHIFGSENDFGLIIPHVSVPCIIHMQGNLIVNNIKWYSGLTLGDLLKFSKKLPLIKGHGLFHSFFVNRKAAQREARILKTCKFFMGRTDWDRRLSNVMSPGSVYFHCDEIMRPGFYQNQWKSHPMRSEYVITGTIRSNIYKGLETIYESRKILKENFPELNIKWRIAGVRDFDEIANLIERKYRGKFSDFDILLLGHMNEEGLINEMMNADLFVHSSHIDNSPNSVCEAMLLGMPVIATYAGGTPSLMTDKNDGLLVQDGDPYALAGAILEMVRNKDLAVKIGSNARKRALKRNDPSVIVEDVVRIYSSVCKPEKIAVTEVK